MDPSQLAWLVNQIGSYTRTTDARFDPTRLVRVVKEIESPERKPAGNLIHHPGELDGVFTGDGRFLWPVISFTIQASWMESSPRGSTITSGDYFPVDQDFRTLASC